jgi:hypothetical protein
MKDKERELLVLTITVSIIVLFVTACISPATFWMMLPIGIIGPGGRMARAQGTQQERQ